MADHKRPKLSIVETLRNETLFSQNRKTDPKSMIKVSIWVYLNERCMVPLDLEISISMYNAIFDYRNGKEYNIFLLKRALKIIHSKLLETHEWKERKYYFPDASIDGVTEEDIYFTPSEKLSKKTHPIKLK